MVTANCWAKRRWKSRSCAAHCGYSRRKFVQQITRAQCAKIYLPSRRLLVENLPANVRPKFLHLVGNSVPHDEHGKCGDIAADGAVFRRVIRVGNGRSEEHTSEL